MHIKDTFEIRCKQYMDDLKDYLLQEFLLIPQREEFVSGDRISIHYHLPLIIPEKPLVKHVLIYFCIYLFDDKPIIRMGLDLEHDLKMHIGLKTTKSIIIDSAIFTLEEIGKSNLYKKSEYDIILKYLYIISKNNNLIIEIINNTTKSQILDNIIILNKRINNLSDLTGCDLEEYYSIIRNELK